MSRWFDRHVTPPQSGLAQEALGPERVRIGWDISAYGPGAVVIARQRGEETYMSLLTDADEGGYPGRVREVIEKYYRAATARGDIATIRVLARFPWYLHHLARTPAWALIKGGVR